MARVDGPGGVVRRSTRAYPRARLSLLVGFALAILLVLAILARYPGEPAFAFRHLAAGGAALLALIAFGVWIGVRGVGARGMEASAALGRGLWLGCLCGLLWVVEIGFNNFVSPEVSTAQARGVVDNGIWAAVALLILGVAVRCAYETRRVAIGLQAGYWCGLVSGLMASLMGLLLVVVWMGFLLRDPLAIQEYAERGLASGESDFAAYVAYETMPGAVLGHFLVLGVGMGAALGGLGGALGRGFRALLG